MPKTDVAAMYSRIQERELGGKAPSSIINAARGSRKLIQRLAKWRVLTGHNGCVNTISWNDSGDKILSGSDDCYLKLYHVGTNKLIESIRSGHQANIFSAKFLPNTSDQKILSCCGGGKIYYNELGIDTFYGQNYFNCHAGTTYEVSVIPGDPHCFLSCGEDGTVRHFDLRVKSNCYCQECKENVLVERLTAITALAVNPTNPYQFGAGCEDSYVRVYDARFISAREENFHSSQGKPSNTKPLGCFKPKSLQKSSCRITSLQFDESGENMLVSYCSDYVYLFSFDRRKKQPCERSDNSACNSSAMSDFSETDLGWRRPTIKKLRLRGDWSDTGPSSRPENEQQLQAQNSNLLMRRISDVFSRWLDDALQARATQAQSSESDNKQPRNDTQSKTVKANLSKEELDEESREGESRRSCGSLSASSLDRQARDDQSPCPLHYPRCSLCFAPIEGGKLRRCFECEAKACAESSLNKEKEAGFDGKKKNDNQISPTDGANFGKTPFSSSPAAHFEACTNSIADTKPRPSVADAACLCLEENATGLEHNCGVFAPDNSDHFRLRSNGNSNEQARHDSRRSPGELDCSQNVSLHGGSRNALGIGPPYTSGETIRETDGDGPEQAKIDAATRIQRYFRASKTKADFCAGIDDGNDSSLKAILLMRFRGHRNVRTMIKQASFWGNSFVLSGSDCGRIFIWDRNTGDLVSLLEGDRHVVNCVQPHPFDPVLATSGIDYDVKVWAPLAEEPILMKDIDEIISRNEKMLEESRDTITVPASFMLRMFASLSRRQGRRNAEQGDGSNE